MRCLIVRTSSLGDVVQGLPVLVALRRRFPKARIGWVVEAAFAPLLADHPDLDELFVVQLRAWRRRPLAPSTLAEIRLAVERLRGFGADYAIDLMGNHKGGLLAALAGAGRSVGLARRLRREPASALWIEEPVATEARHAVDRYLACLAPLGVTPAPADFAPERLAPNVSASAPLGGAPYAFVHPGAAWGNKRYPAARWGEVARGLLAELGLCTVVGAAPGEEALAKDVEAAAAGAARALPARTLAELIGLARGAALCLGGDTGPLHLAAALGRPVVAVLGPTDPARHGPRGAPAVVVTHALPCSYCHRRMAEPRRCLEAIAAGEVVAAARQLTS